uniref:Uncharacterized protein n=1 Tax=Anopheles dirus TaxID=7168 RepID=A0A182NXD3_9DIPT
MFRDMRLEEDKILLYQKKAKPSYLTPYIKSEFNRSFCSCLCNRVAMQSFDNRSR